MIRLARKFTDKHSSTSIFASPSHCLSMFSASTNREDHSSFPTFLPNDFVDRTIIFEGSQITVSDASTITDLFSSRYKLSDECSTDLNSLIENLVPVSNNFPLVIHLSKKLRLILKTACEFSRNRLKIPSAFLIFAFKLLISLNENFCFNFTVLLFPRIWWRERFYHKFLSHF